jgi:hypothetical protein
MLLFYLNQAKFGLHISTQPSEDMKMAISTPQP